MTKLQQHEGSPMLETAHAASQPDINLLDVPWIPVRMLDGTAVDLGLLALFRQANRISGISDHRPPTVIAIYRMLLAILHRSLSASRGTWTDQDRASWYRADWPLAAIEAYLEKLRERFFVFHPEFPFMQVAQLATISETADKSKRWTQISLDAASGNNPVVFDHSSDVNAVDRQPADLVLDLLGFLQFTPGGLVKTLRSSDKAGPLSNTAAALSIGPSLQHTLLLNLHPAQDPATRLADLPAWERKPLAQTDLLREATPAQGCNDRYTRLSRAVLFMRKQTDTAPVISEIRFAVGEALADDPNAPDSMASYRMGSKDLVRITFQEGRSAWRDLGSLLPDPVSGSGRPGAVLEWSRNLLDLLDDDTAEASPILVAGMCSDQAKLVRWRSELYRIPEGAFRSADSAVEIRRRLEQCEELHYQVRMAATQMVAEAMPTSSSKDTRDRARSAVDSGPLTPEFFAAAERGLPQLMRLVCNGDLDRAYDQWRQTLSGAATAAWSAATLQMGSSTAAVRAQAKTTQRFQKLLHGLHQANEQGVNP